MKKEKKPVSALSLDTKIINEICYCHYIRGIGNAQIGRYFKLTYKQISDILRETKEFRAWIERNGKWIPVYYEVDGKKIVTKSLTTKIVTKFVTTSSI